LKLIQAMPLITTAISSNTMTNNTNISNQQIRRMEQDIAELHMHMARLRCDVNELQRQNDDLREWKSTMIPLIQMMATLVVRNEQTALNTAQNILQQANNLSVD
jgi:ABC-type oligopeptide transport system substrate-binding subunit